MKSHTHNKNDIVFGLYGAGGFGREVMPFMKQQIAATKVKTSGIYFLETSPTSNEVNGYPRISEKAFFELECSERYFNVAIADSKARERIVNECLAKGAKPLTIQAPDFITYGNNEIGEGGIFCARTMVTTNVKIGKFFHLHMYSYVAHDCVIGDFVTFAPNVNCNGNVHIGNHAFIGSGAIIKQGSLAKPRIIGEGAIVGMGAVVTKDVPPFATVVGNPAKPKN